MTRKEEIEKLDKAIEECKFFQFRPKEHQNFKNPLTGQELILNTARSKRHFETKRDGGKTGITPVHECMYCNFETTPTLFYVDVNGNIAFPDYDQALHARSRFQEKTYPYPLEKMDDYYKMVKEIASSHRLEGDWFCRVFLNLTPAIVQKNSKANCFLIATHPGFHYSEISDLPIIVLEAVIKAMKFLTDWANENGLVLNPFYNGGKSLASGQSVDCLHFQVYALPEMPKLYKNIKKVWRDGGCLVCRIRSAAPLGSPGENCRISWEGNFEIYVHPYPEYNFTLLITTTETEGFVDESRFEQIDSQGLAKALKKAVSFYPLLFNTMPAYNILFRLPEYVGHFHVEIIPRTNTNIIAGCELNTKTIVITQDPRDVAAAIKEKADEKGIKL